jgi:hypothetical protein
MVGAPGVNEPAPDRRHRGREDLVEVRRRPELPLVAFEAVNRARGSRYPVYLPAAPSLEGGMCTCEDFARRGRGTCKHLEAVATFLSEHPDEGLAVPLDESAEIRRRWQAIDARWVPRGGDPRPWPDRLRWVGRVLIELPSG